MDTRIAVVGLGYVGLPVALAFAEQFPGTIGFDINRERVNSLSQGVDSTGDVSQQKLLGSGLRFSANEDELRQANFFVVAVPTPIDENHTADLDALCAATKMVGRVMASGSVIVFESTVYPGVTEEICRKVLADESGLVPGVDFKLAYSPERINPGDTVNTLEKIVKIVSGEDAETLDYVARVYESIIHAGVHRAPSIRVAEAAKVVENVQRDLNIALMNELAMIFDKMDIRTHDVLEAAGTKWNFMKFSPGLVGGHCIGVDPYYLVTKAEQMGYHPDVILAGRRINDSMGFFVAGRTVKMMINTGRPLKGARIAVLGLSFKEDVSDFRNSRVPDIISELRTYGVTPLAHDPLVDPDEARNEYGIQPVAWDELTNLDGMIMAVNHRAYLEQPLSELTDRILPGGVFVDVKSACNPADVRPDLHYWAL